MSTMEVKVILVGFVKNFNFKLNRDVDLIMKYIVIN